MTAERTLLIGLVLALWIPGGASAEDVEGTIDLACGTADAASPPAADTLRGVGVCPALPDEDAGPQPEPEPDLPAAEAEPPVDDPVAVADEAVADVATFVDETVADPAGTPDRLVALADALLSAIERLVGVPVDAAALVSDVLSTVLGVLSDAGVDVALGAKAGAATIATSAATTAAASVTDLADALGRIASDAGAAVARLWSSGPSAGPVPTPRLPIPLPSAAADVGCGLVAVGGLLGDAVGCPI
ncbi:MAG: hypothetical protein ACT4PT_11030 [Methanobacteriota archaeon]